MRGGRKESKEDTEAEWRRRKKREDAGAGKMEDRREREQERGERKKQKRRWTSKVARREGGEMERAGKEEGKEGGEKGKDREGGRTEREREQTKEEERRKDERQDTHRGLCFFLQSHIRTVFCILIQALVRYKILFFTARDRKKRRNRKENFSELCEKRTSLHIVLWNHVGNKICLRLFGNTRRQREQPALIEGGEAIHLNMQIRAHLQRVSPGRHSVLHMVVHIKRDRNS